MAGETLRLFGGSVADVRQKDALGKRPKARAFFAKLNSQDRYAILFRIQTANKAETRRKRIEQFIRMLERHEKLHP
jgi:uncharacterized protein YdeI (YjbR/CyaY-like superfamily)